jgi:hypothetical protein
MATYTARPVAQFGSLYSQNGFSFVGGTTNVLNLGDQLDTSYAEPTAAQTTGTIIYGQLSNPSIPADEFTARVVAKARWGNSGTANISRLRFRTYRQQDSTTTIADSGDFYLPSQASPTTSDLITVSNSRLNAEISSAKFRLDVWKPTGTVPRTYELALDYKTIKNATATPAATTMTNSPYAIIPVTATATIDWESTAADATNLRRVITEVRVEQGGTGVGTGTLKELSGSFYTANFSATGSQVVNVQLNNALPNGTYKVYARAVRFRENQSYTDAYDAVDQTSAWSSAATLTMNNPLPTAPTTTATPDQTLDRQAIAVTPIATSGHTLPRIDVERSIDAGTTWTAVRGVTNIAGTFGAASTFYDYECPRASSLVQYRARVNTTYTGGLAMTSNWTTVSATAITANDWNIKCPEDSTLNMLDVQVTEQPTESIIEDIGVFRPLDRRYPITVSGSLGGWDGNLSIVTASNAEWDKLKALLETQKVLLLESNFGWSKYIRIVSGAKIVLLGSATAPRRKIQVDYVETTAP